MTILPLRSGVAFAVVGAIAGVASGSARHCAPPRTVTVTKTVMSTTTQPGVPALVSRRARTAGPYVARPASLDLVSGYLSDVNATCPRSCPHHRSTPLSECLDNRSPIEEPDAAKPGRVLTL
jgi:hypothetical protein